MIPKETIYTSKSIQQIFERYSGDLRDYKKLFSQNMFNIHYVRVQITNGMAYLHKNHFIHRDLKPENVLYAQRHQIKIIDLGMAKQFVKKYE